MKNRLICRGCNERPVGCWKAVECSCNHERERLFREATACPIGRWEWPTIDLREVDGLIYSGPGRRVRLGEGLPRLQRFVGEPFRGNFRIEVARDYGRLLQFRRPPFLLLEEDCIGRGPLETIYYPPGADMLMLGGGNRGAGRAHLKAGAKRAYGYSYEEVDENWMRVWGMLYTHALLFLSERAIALVSESFLRANRPGDQITAILQHDLAVYCLKRPLLVQDGNDQTWNYAPLAIPPLPRHQQISRLRKDRREALAWRRN